jgi:hypothetical protein
MPDMKVVVYRKWARKPLDLQLGDEWLSCQTCYHILWYNSGMKRKTSMQLTDEALRLLVAMAQADGISHTAMMEIAIREAARKRGIRADLGIQAESQQQPTSRD